MQKENACVLQAFSFVSELCSEIKTQAADRAGGARVYNFPGFLAFLTKFY